MAQKAIISCDLRGNELYPDHEHKLAVSIDAYRVDVTCNIEDCKYHAILTPEIIKA